MTEAGNRTLKICRGLQGSGKSTYAEAWVAESPKTRSRINRDTIRITYFNSYWGPEVDETAVTVIELTIAEALMAGTDNRSIVVDNTNLKESAVNPYLVLAYEYNYEVEFVDFNVDLAELIRRDGVRDKPVTEAVIRSYHEKFIVDGLLPPTPVFDGAFTAEVAS